MSRAKTAVPRAPASFVERAPLRARLDRLAAGPEDGPVVLVSATAGYGKTLTVADWVRSRPEVGTAWVTLDRTDRDADRFRRSLQAALTGCRALPVTSPLRSERAPGRPDELLVALDELTDPVDIVLDDLHEIVGYPAFEVVRELVRHPLRQVNLVLCSRFDPPLGLDRLRLAERLGEIRSSDLRFGPEEAAALLGDGRADLRPDQVETLLARTEGWPAALRLAALSLRSAPDVDAFVADFAGDDRSVADYLVDEVVSGLAASEYDLLAATSVCDVVDADAAVQLTGDPGAAERLARLAAVSGMLTPLDRHGRRFRLHELLRSHIVARLRRREPERLADLHGRAAVWYEAHGAPAEALRHSAEVGDATATAALLRRRAVELFARGELVALAGSLENGTQDAPPRTVDPRLLLMRAVVALETGEIGRADELIDAAAHAPSDGETVNLAMFRRIVDVRRHAARGRPRDGVARAREIDPEAIDDTGLRALARATRAPALLVSDPAVARGEAERVLETAERHGWDYLALQAETTLGVLRTLDGGSADLARSAQTLLDEAGRRGWSQSIWSIAALAMLGAAELRRGRPEAARDAARQAERSGADRFGHLALLVASVHGAAESDLGDPAAGWRRLRHARLTSTPGEPDEHLMAFAALLEQEAALAAGRLREAREVLRAVTPRLEGTPELALLRARLAWVSAHDPGARRHLAPVLELDLPVAVVPVAVEAPLLDAEIALHRGERTVAHRRLRTALERAQHLEVLRPFGTLSPATRAYLAEHLGSFGGLDALARRVLATTGSRARSPLEALTDRERTVLDLLPTQRSTSEIAEDLAVSVNTVKTHVRAIYAKLQVDNRRHAVTEARRHGLLETEGLTLGG